PLALLHPLHSTAPPPTATYTLSLHDALPIFGKHIVAEGVLAFLLQGTHTLDDHRAIQTGVGGDHTHRLLKRAAQDADTSGSIARSEEHTSELQSRENLVCRLLLEKKKTQRTA